MDQCCSLASSVYLAFANDFLCCRVSAGEEWRKLTMMAKAPYEQKAEEERRKYEVAMKEYNVVRPLALKKCSL